MYRSHVDPLIIQERNARMSDASRRQGIIVNRGSAVSRCEILRRMDENKKLYYHHHHHHHIMTQYITNETHRHFISIGFMSVCL